MTGSGQASIVAIPRATCGPIVSPGEKAEDAAQQGSNGNWDEGTLISLLLYERVDFDAVFCENRVIS